MEIKEKLKYCLYARKSSEQDERQAMSIDSQIKEMQALADRENLLVTEIKRESHSAKLSASRPQFMKLIEELRDGTFDAILTWAPDRLSRNAGDLGSLVDLMDSNKLIMIRTQSQSFSNNPNEKFLLMILCSQAKLENDNRAINVKRGIRAKCETGWRPCMPPLGYFTRGASGNGKDVILDKERAPYIRKMFEMAADGKSGRHIRQWLTSNNVKMRSGKDIPLSVIYNIFKNPFYYGEFEHPVGSGNWYQGKHDPIVSRELYEEVQKQHVVPLKSKWGSKDFPFKQFLKCASCGSTVVGEEKFKKLKRGGTRRHVYYHCSRQVDYACKEPFVREDKIIDELSRLATHLTSIGIDVEPGLKQASDRYKLMLGLDNKDSSDLELGYVQYVLKNGTDFEKTRLVRNLSVKLMLHNRKLINHDTVPTNTTVALAGTA
jgi:DNA invertase Pin-like site-specific DNA recombinase